MWRIFSLKIEGFEYIIYQEYERIIQATHLPESKAWKYLHHPEHSNIFFDLLDLEDQFFLEFLKLFRNTHRCYYYFYLKQTMARNSLTLVQYNSDARIEVFLLGFPSSHLIEWVLIVSVSPWCQNSPNNKNDYRLDDSEQFELIVRQGFE